MVINMKIVKMLVCYLAVISMIAMLGGCATENDDEPRSTESAAATQEVPTVSQIPELENPYEDRTDLIIQSWGEYVSRPKRIQEGTVLNYQIKENVLSLTPWFNNDESWIMGNVFEGLLYMYMNDPGDIRGLIAENWTISDDYLTWTFQIREGLEFTDGTVCDANAIERSWSLYESQFSFARCNIVSWEAASSNEFVVKLSEPCGFLELALSGRSFPILSPDALELHGADDYRSAVSTGPYYIKSCTPGESVTLSANENYYFEEKLPAIETVNLSATTINSQNAFDELINGKIDGLLFSETATYKTLLEHSSEIDTIATLSGANTTLWMNAEVVPAFQLFEVRKAMNRFIDFNAVNEELFNGMGLVMDSLWAPGTSSYVPTDQYYYDVKGGQELLASVGLAASEIEFELTFQDLSFSNDITDMLESIQNQLSKAGTNMTLNRIGRESSMFYKPNETAFAIGSVGYRNTEPYLPWWYSFSEMKRVLNVCWQESYNPELYMEMTSEYNKMTKGSMSFEEVISHSQNLTKYVQDDFGAIIGVQEPAFVALSRDFKNGIYFTENQNLQFYYLFFQKEST